MNFDIIIQVTPTEVITELQVADAKKYGKVIKCLELLEANPRHRGLASHQFVTMTGPNGEPVWESYVENNTPSAWRVWWFYGPQQGQITVVSIGPHP